MPASQDWMWSIPRPAANKAEGRFFIYSLSMGPGSLSISLGHPLTRNTRFVEFETANDLKTAVEKLDGHEFKGSRVTCVADVRNPASSPEISSPRSLLPRNQRPVSSFSPDSEP